MQGIWLEKQQLQLKTDLPIPDSRTGEVKVRVLRAGICNTDLELLRGYYPYKGILGHDYLASGRDTAEIDFSLDQQILEKFG